MDEPIPALSERLPAGFRALADDVMTEVYGDPHVAFAVLVYPDRHPEVVAITSHQRGACPMVRLRSVGADEPPKKERPDNGRFFEAGDLDDASDALSAAHRALTSRYRESKNPILGERIVAEIELLWQRKRDHQVERELKAAVEAAKPRCPHCGGKYTTRGLPIHLARSAVCSKIEARAKAEAGD